MYLDFPDLTLAEMRPYSRFRDARPVKAVLALTAPVSSLMILSSSILTIAAFIVVSRKYLRSLDFPALRHSIVGLC